MTVDIIEHPDDGILEVRATGRFNAEAFLWPTAGLPGDNQQVANRLAGHCNHLLILFISDENFTVLLSRQLQILNRIEFDVALLGGPRKRPLERAKMISSRHLRDCRNCQPTLVRDTA